MGADRESHLLKPLASLWAERVRPGQSLAILLLGVLAVGLDAFVRRDDGSLASV